MKIVIAGAGQVGSHLAKLLSNEDQDIIVIDEETSRLANLDIYNLLTFKGKVSSFKTLKSVSVANSDLFIAVTPEESQNIAVCTMAKALGAKKTVARIDNHEYILPENREFFKNQGVDALIYPEYLAAKEIHTALKRTWVRNWFDMLNGELVVVGVKLRENAKLVGLQLKDFSDISSYMHVSAIKRRHEIIIPGGNDRIAAGDIVYITTTRTFIDNVIAICGKRQETIKKVLIMGGSRIAVQLAYLVKDHYEIKIIERDIERCHRIAELLPKCKVIHGDGRDLELLQEEGIDEMDAFIALTDSSETNILACLTAKEYGVKKSIAEVENVQFIAEAESLNIGTIINKKLLASSRIFQIMLDSDISNAKCLALADAEVTEMVVKEGARITKADVKDLKLSHDLTIAGLVRDGMGQLVQGNTRIQAGDRVVVFCLRGCIQKVERLFS